MNVYDTMYYTAVAVIVCAPGLVTPANPAQAGVIVNYNFDSIAPIDYPDTADLMIAATNASTERTVQNTRSIAQSFDVTESLTLEKLYITYRRGNASRPYTIGLYEVDDVFAGSGTTDNSGLVSLNAQLWSFNLITPATTGTGSDQIRSGDDLSLAEFTLTGSELRLLSPRPGNAGYALVFSGTGSAAFNIRFETSNPYAGGEASGHLGTATNNADLAIAMTLIPEPASLALLGLGGLIVIRRRTV